MLFRSGDRLGFARALLLITLPYATLVTVLTTAMLGALFVVLADLLARNGLHWAHVGPYELPVGVVTAACGAPYLLHLIGRQQKGR